MRAQVSVVSVVLVTGIIIALVGAAYMWGAPLIEKRTIISQFRTAESFMLSLDKAITEIANSGGGSKTLKIPLGLLSFKPENNSLYLEFMVSQPLLFNITVTPLHTTSLDEVGVYGVDEPRIITLKSEKADSGFKLTFELHYRSLRSDSKIYRIKLTGSEQAGSQEIKVWYNRTETENGNHTTYINAEII